MKSANNLPIRVDQSDTGKTVRHFSSTASTSGGGRVGKGREGRGKEEEELREEARKQSQRLYGTRGETILLLILAALLLPVPCRSRSDSVDPFHLSS